MALEEFAPTRRGEPAPVFDFCMIFLRDGVEEAHEFSARPTMGWGDITGFAPLMFGGGKDDVLSIRALSAVDRLIRRALRNDDGTPEKWEPYIVDGHFTDPQGDHTPEELLPAYLAYDAGSSRRRWVHLMDTDDELTIEPEQVMALFNRLMAVASERPTRRSAPSPR